MHELKTDCIICTVLVRFTYEWPGNASLSEDLLAVLHYHYEFIRVVVCATETTDVQSLTRLLITT